MSLCACAPAPSPSTYRVIVPELYEAPVEVACGEHRCIVLYKEDYKNIVRELKAACLANGQSKRECQVP